MSIPLPRRKSPNAWEDPWLAHAEREVANSYGDVVTVKDKSLRKFGRTANADAGVRTTIALFPGTVVNESFVSTNLINSIVSSSAADTETIKIESHTIDGSGLLTFVVQEVTLTGQTPVTLATPSARVNRVYNSNGTFASPAANLVGVISVYESAATTVTAGVPQTATAVHAQIAAGSQQSEKAQTAFSSVDYGVLIGVTASILASSPSANVEIECEVKELGGVWRPVGLELSLRLASSPSATLSLKPYAIIPPNADVRLVATSDANNTEVAGAMEFALLTTS